MVGVVRKIKPSWEPMHEADRLRDWLQKAVNGLYFSGIGSENEALACVSVLLAESVLQDVALSTTYPKSEIWADISDDVVRWTSLQNAQLLRMEFRELFDFSKADSAELYAIYADVVASCANRRLGQENLPTSVVRLMLRLMDVKSGMRLCDPSCSYGHFVDVMQAKDDHGVDLVFAEQDAAKVAIVRTKFILCGRDPLQVRYASGFRDEQQIRSDGFDGVVTFPPYGKRLRVPVGNRSRLNIEIPFRILERLETSYLMRALELVRPGGLVAICLPESDLCASIGQIVKEVLDEVSSVERVVSFARNAVSYSPVVSSLCVLVVRRGRGLDDGKVGLSIVRRPPCGAVGEKSQFFTLNDIRRRESKAHGIWSPKVFFSDCELTDRLHGRRVTRVGDLFEMATYPRTDIPDRNLYYLEHGVDGVERSKERVPDVPNRMVYRDIAIANAVMVTARAWSLSVGAIPTACDGMVLGRSSQLYVPKSKDDNTAVAMEMLCKTSTYRRYLMNRFVGGEWRDDFLDYLVPWTPFMEPSESVRAYVALQDRKYGLRDRLRTLSQVVSNKYRQWLGIHQSGGLRAMFWTEKFPTEQLGALAQGVKLCEIGSEDEILRNLKVSAPVLDSDYLAGYLICDFQPSVIRDVVRLRSFRAYYGSNISSISIPLPPLAVQRRIVSDVERELMDFRSTIRELALVQEHEERALLEDVERRCFG